MIFYGPSGGDKGIGKSKFKNWNFSIPMVDSDSLQKSTNVKWSPFFHIQMLSKLKSRKTLKFLDKRATMIICLQIWTFFLILAVITSKYRKMKTTLHSYFFARNLNLQSELKNSNFWILTFLYPCSPLTAHKRSSKKFEKNIFRFSFYLGFRIAALKK